MVCIVPPMKIGGSLLIALVLANPARADEPPAPGWVTARTIATSALLGFKFAIEDNATGKPDGAKVLECARTLDERPLADVFQALLSADMSTTEIAELDRFFSSTAGKKYERMGQLGIYAARGKSMSEPKPEFSTAEYSQLEAFSKTSAGKKYIYDRWLEKPQVQSALQEKLLGMLRECRGGS